MPIQSKMVDQTLVENSKAEIKKIEKMVETEELTRRVQAEIKQKTKAGMKKKVIKKPSFFVQTLNVMHYIMASIFIFLTINYISRYMTFKKGEDIDFEAAKEIIKATVSLSCAIFTAFMRALLMDQFENDE